MLRYYGSLVSTLGPTAHGLLRRRQFRKATLLRLPLAHGSEVGALPEQTCAYGAAGGCDLGELTRNPEGLWLSRLSLLASTASVVLQNAGISRTCSTCL